VTAARHAAAGRMAEAAGRLLGTLTPDELALAAWPFPSDEERRRWFYTPTDHGGLTLGALDPARQRLVMQLVASGLSTAGFVTASTILGLENVLDHLEGWSVGFGHPRGRDPQRYYVRVFGDPGDGTWAWRFGGHHVSLHHLVVDGELAASTPCFLGADPASAPLLGPHPLRPLAGAEDLGRELVRSLDASQLATALVSPAAPADLVGGNRSRLTEGDLPLPLPEVWRGRFEGELLARVDAIQAATEQALGLQPAHLDALRYTTAPVGLAVPDLSADQRELLVALLRVYVERLPEDVAGEQLAVVLDGLDDLRFLWAGGLEPGQPHYYRVQGPRLVVEYDNAARGGNHVHTVWRDPRNDFGDDALARHHATHPH
jgi:hypothetical protein